MNNGRSTPGILGLNDTGGKSWAELWPLKDYLNEVSLAEMGTKAPEKAKNQEKKEQTQPEEQRPTTEEVKAARKAARKAKKANANNSK